MKKPRHLSSKKSNAWTDLRSEIAQLSEQLNIPKNEFSPVSLQAWHEIERKVWSEFSTRSNTLWIWESLKHPHAAMLIKYNDPAFSDLIDHEETVWFLLNETDNERDKFWIYEGKVTAFDKLFGESCLIDEVIIVSRKLVWILVLNHHDVLSGTGPMKSKIEQYPQLSSTI